MQLFQSLISSTNKNITSILSHSLCIFENHKWCYLFFVGFSIGLSMNWKYNIWKFLAAFVVVLIILNPETVQLAFFIDAIGLEMFLMLLEIQFLVTLGLFFTTYIKPVFLYFTGMYSRHFLSFSWKTIKEKPEILMLTVPSPATLMHMLVLVAIIEIITNTH